MDDKNEEIIASIKQQEIINSKTSIQENVEQAIKSQTRWYYREGLKKFLVKISVIIFLLIIVVVLVLHFLSQREKEPPYIEIGEYALLSNEDALHRDFIPTNFETKVQELDYDQYSASAILAYNPANEQIFYQHKADKEVPIASLTKLMSALIIRSSFDTDEILTVGDLSEDLEWTLGLEKGDKVSVEDLLHAMLISSYNDAGFVVAQNYKEGGLEGFVDAMNRKAEQLGLEHTHFANPVGYDDPYNYSTANDLKRIVYLFMQDDYLMNIVRKKNYEITINHADGEFEKMKLTTTNDLLDGRYVRGIKTGYTEDAKQCLISYFYANEGDQLVLIILGSEDRFEETKQLLEDIKEGFED